MVNLFSYKNSNSILHKTPVLIKLFLMIIICIFTFKGKFDSSVSEILSLNVIIRTSICFFISILAFVLSKAKLKTILQLKFVFILGFVITLFKMFRFTQYLSQEELQTGYFINFLSFMTIDVNGFASGILYTIRFFITTLFAQVIFETTSVLEIKEALESLENILAKIFPPIKKLNLALIISLSINFIPQIFSTWNKVKTASKARSNTKNQTLVTIVKTSLQELQTLLSCLLYQAETKRQALINRSK